MMNSKKILYLTPEGFDTPNSDNHLAITLSKYFLLNGYKFKIIQSRKTGINPDIPEELKGYEGLECLTIKRKKVSKTNFLQRYLDEIRYHIATIKYYKHDNEISCVILQSCPTVVFQMIFINFFLKKPVIYNLFDVFPGSAYSTGSINSRILYSILNYFQKIAYKFSDKIVVISEDMKNILLKLNVSEKKIEIIVNWYDDQNIKEIPMVENKFLKKYGINGSKFVIQFAGNIGTVFDYEVVLHVAIELQHYHDIEFHMIGDGVKLIEFQNKVKQAGLSNILFFPWQPLEIISDVYSACDVGFIPLKRGVIGNGVPSKAALLMACKKVVVNAVEDSCYSRMFQTNKIGFSFDQSEVKKLAKCILTLYEDNDKRIEIGENAKKFGNNYYSSSENVYKFVDLVEELI